MAEIRSDNGLAAMKNHGFHLAAGDLDKDLDPDPLVRILTRLNEKVRILEIEVEKLKATQDTNIQL